MAAYVSPDGVITRYSLDVGFEPLDMKIALVEAGNGTVGTVVDQFILWCSNFDPDANSYVPQAWIIMKLAGACTVGIVLDLPGSLLDQPQGNSANCACRHPERRIDFRLTERKH